MKFFLAVVFSIFPSLLWAQNCAVISKVQVVAKTSGVVSNALLSPYPNVSILNVKTIRNVRGVYQSVVTNVAPGTTVTLSGLVTIQPGTGCNAVVQMQDNSSILPIVSQSFSVSQVFAIQWTNTTAGTLSLTLDDAVGVAPL